MGLPNIHFENGGPILFLPLAGVRAGGQGTQSIGDRETIEKTTLHRRLFEK